MPIFAPDIAGCDLVLVGGEGGLDGPSRAWDLEDLQSESAFGCNLVEFDRGDPEVPVGLLKPSEALVPSPKPAKTMSSPQ